MKKNILKNLEVKVIRGDYKDLQEELNILLNDGFILAANIVITPDSYLYAVLTKEVRQK